MSGAKAEVEKLQKLTRGPAAPKDVISELRERELRERLEMLPKDRRQPLLDEAVAHGDDRLISAMLSVPSFVAGMSRSEQDMLRHHWVSKRYPTELKRIELIEKAITDAERAGSLTISFINSLTDPEIIEAAQKSEKAAADALKLVKR
jgi:hypothetical protein